jgi:hypothetical protein
LWFCHPTGNAAYRQPATVTNRYSRAKQVHNPNDPLEVLQRIREQPERTIFLLKDSHLFLADPNPIIVRKLKDVLLEGKTWQKTLIILGCRLILPPELEREITVVELALPRKEALSHVLDGIVDHRKPAWWAGFLLAVGWGGGWGEGITHGNVRWTIWRDSPSHAQ